MIREQKRKYAILWFQNLCRFHHVKDADRWNYTAENVVAFLRAQLAKGTPTWKRLKIVEGLMFHCMYVRKTDATFLSSGLLAHPCETNYSGLHRTRTQRSGTRTRTRNEAYDIAHLRPRTT